MTEDWLARWVEGRTGWHEEQGNAALRRHWPDLPAGNRVLVPLCGKSRDLLWLESRKLVVVGVELSRLAIEAFFAENDLSYAVSSQGTLQKYRCVERNITLYCGDYFAVTFDPCDALYDRGALVALEKNRRASYARHTDSLLLPGAMRFLVTLEYDQALADGPPYSVDASEVETYWPDLYRAAAKSDLENSPPKFRDAGIEELVEVVWMSSVREKIKA